MARLIGPDANSRLVYTVVGPRLAAAVAATATVYADAAGAALADIRAYDGTDTPGAAITGSTLTVDQFSLLPLFWFPDGVDAVWVRVGGDGPLVKVNADYDSRLDALGTNIARNRGAWAPNTAYLAGDGVTYAGGSFLVASAHTSDATFSLANLTSLNEPHRFNVAWYGAQGNGTTDDTAAINAAVAAGFNAGVANGTNYAEIYFPPGVYLLSSPTTKGGSTFGNAQIPLPYVDTANEKFVMAFAGTVDASAFVHWEQQVSQTSGAVLKSTLTGQTLDGTWGAPSVIGGPTVPNGSGVYSNMKCVVSGVTVVAPYNPSIVGLDFKYLAQATVLSAACLTDAPALGSPSIRTTPTNDLGLGLRMPQNGNNDCALVVDYACEGFYYGIAFGEHLTALRLACVYLAVGMFISTGGGSFHGATITNLSIEATDIGIQAVGTPGSGFPLDIAQMSVETLGTRDVDDPNSVLRGTINWTNADAGQPVPRVNGATGLKVLALTPGNKPGNVTPPAVPASTAALVNPFWRDAAVVVAGGTVSAIAVDGVPTGYTNTGHTVVVPSGKTITLTYSAAPTWVWTLL